MQQQLQAYALMVKSLLLQKWYVARECMTLTFKGRADETRDRCLQVFGVFCVNSGTHAIPFSILTLLKDGLAHVFEEAVKVALDPPNPERFIRRSTSQTRLKEKCAIQ